MEHVVSSNMALSASVFINTLTMDHYLLINTNITMHGTDVYHTCTEALASFPGFFSHANVEHTKTDKHKILRSSFFVCSTFAQEKEPENEATEALDCSWVRFLAAT